VPRPPPALLPFAKMHGCANDYLFVDAFAGEPEGLESLARAMSDRRRGVGADGLILALPSERADFRMRMFNADGSESEMCGNGLRCLAKFVYERGLVARRPRLTAETGAGVLAVDLEVEGGLVHRATVDMGPPRLERAEIPMLGPPGPVREEPLAGVEVAGRPLRVTAVSMGNPHAVAFVDGLVEDLDAFPVEEVGPRVERHPAFPRRANAEFVRVLSRGEVQQRTWERGAGETYACGTGACAVVVAGVLTGRLDGEVLVHLRGGDLAVRWPGEGSVYLSGPAVEVFRGAWPLGR
jgi:diaminopimelate epimerase